MIFSSFTSRGQQCNVLKRFFAYLKIKQDIKRGSMHKSKKLLDKAKEMALKVWGIKPGELVKQELVEV